MPLQIVEFEGVARDGAAVTPAARAPFLRVTDLTVPPSVADAHTLLDACGLVRIATTEDVRLWLTLGAAAAAGDGYWLPGGAEVYFSVSDLHAVVVRYVAGAL